MAQLLGCTLSAEPARRAYEHYDTQWGREAMRGFGISSRSVEVDEERAEGLSQSEAVARAKEEGAMKRPLSVRFGELSGMDFGDGQPPANVSSGLIFIAWPSA